MRLVMCTVPKKDAETLANALITQKLAACVNIVSEVLSIYSWRGEICREEESLLLIKTTAYKIDSLTDGIKQNHPYDVPEIISLEIEPKEGNAAYLEWVRDCVT